MEKGARVWDGRLRVWVTLVVCGVSYAGVLLHHAWLWVPHTGGFPAGRSVSCS